MVHLSKFLKVSIWGKKKGSIFPLKRLTLSIAAWIRWHRLIFDFETLNERTLKRFVSMIKAGMRSNFLLISPFELINVG